MPAFAGSAPAATPGGVCGEHSRSQRQQQGAFRVSSRTWEGGFLPFPEQESLISHSRVRRGGRNLGDQSPRDAAPRPSDALVSWARSVAGRGLTAALSLLPVVIAARECGCEGSELLPSREETPGRRKSPSQSCEKGVKENILHSVFVPCGEFFLNVIIVFLKRNISLLLPVIISGGFSQNHRHVTNQTREAGSEAVPAASGHQSHLGTGTHLRRPRGCGSDKLWGERGGLGAERAL